MEIPIWTELTDHQRFRLQSAAASFGTDLSQEREKADENLVLPTDREALAIAAEMYMGSRMIIEEILRSNAQ